MENEEILSIMQRITRDFAKLIPRIKLEVVSSQAYHARIKGRPLLPQERPEEMETSLYPLRALPSSCTILVDLEGTRVLVEKEALRLRRPLVEGLILREIIYLAVHLQAFPDAMSRAEAILRRHWPLQYTLVKDLNRF